MSTISRDRLVIALFAGIFFIPFLGGVHLFDWDEINFAEISREMLLTREWFRVYVDFQPFWEKPPFFFWLQAGAMQIFGVGEFAARLPNAIAGIITLVLLYDLGRRIRSRTFGWLWAGAYFGSVLPFLYFKSGIIDPWFNLFIFLGLYFFIRFYWAKEKVAVPGNAALHPVLYLLIGGFVLGFGILTKGPVAYLLVVLTLGIYWLFKRFEIYVSPLQFLLYSLAASAVTLAWYGLETLQHGPWFVTEFNRYQYRLFSTPDAGHKGFPGYHFIVLLVGVFPASIFAIRSFFRTPREEAMHFADFKRWMAILFWVVLILFTIVKSKIVHYSSMCYFPMTFLAAVTMEQLLEKKISWNRWMSFGFWSIGGLYVLATTLLPFLGQRIEWLKPLFQKDPFALANLDAEVEWSVWDVYPGVFLLGILIYTFVNIQQNRYAGAFKVLFPGTALFVMLVLIANINKIESYSQRAAIEFMKDRQEEDCYVITHGYKSYAHLFYTMKTKPQNPRYYDKDWLLNGDIDKPVYVVTKINKVKELEENPHLVEIDRKNGFVFFKRKK